MSGHVRLRVHTKALELPEVLAEFPVNGYRKIQVTRKLPERVIFRSVQPSALR